MKAFQFRLAPALRWRSAQLGLEQERLSQAVRHAAALESELSAGYSELRVGAAQLVSAGSAAFESWAAWADRCHRRIQILDGQLKAAKKALALQRQRMVEAHRKVRVLENLKRDGNARWERDLGRETESFAGEAFLIRLAHDSRPTKRADPPIAR
jgi:hypothetical protein